MKITSTEIITFPGGRITRGSDGDLSFAWSDSEAGLVFGAAAVNGFSETAGLSGKERRHSSIDGLSARLELETILPFGAEFTCLRQFEIGDGWTLATCDIIPGGPGRIQSFELEPLVFRGSWRELLLDGESVAVDRPFNRTQAVPFRRIQLRNAAGWAVEIGQGDDLWRWTPEGADGEFSVAVDGDAVTVRRRVLNFQAGDAAELAKRPYRFQWYLAWSGGSAETPEAGAVLPWPAGESACLKAATVQRLLRREIRRSEGSRVFAWGEAGDCGEAAHLERPGRGDLAHRDLMERVRFYHWANRQLLKKGGSFRWDIPAERRTGILEQVVSRPPRSGVAVEQE